MKAERKAINYLDTSDIDSSEAEGRPETSISVTQGLTSELGEQRIEISNQSSNTPSTSSFTSVGSCPTPSHVFGLGA